MEFRCHKATQQKEVEIISNTTKAPPGEISKHPCVRLRRATVSNFLGKQKIDACESVMPRIRNTLFQAKLESKALIYFSDTSINNL
jgi:hypothetical protein